MAPTTPAPETKVDPHAAIAEATGGAYPTMVYRKKKKGIGYNTKTAMSQEDHAALLRKGWKDSYKGMDVDPDDVDADDPDDDAPPAAPAAAAKAPRAAKKK